MEEVGQAAQLRAGELIIIVVVLVMWAGRSSSPLADKWQIGAQEFANGNKEIGECWSDVSKAIKMNFGLNFFAAN